MKRILLSGLLMGVASIAGCGGSDNSSSSGQNQVAGKTPSGGVQKSTKTQPVVTDAVGTQPGEVVAIFLDSLRRGDEKAANAVLTSVAQEELKKTDYEIQPLGTPAGTYKIGRVGYPYEEKNVALVECVWSEPEKPGQPSEGLDIVCEVHQEPQGWRIAGLGVKVAGTEDTLVLDFEDSKSLQQVIDQATGGKTQAPPQQLPPAIPGGDIAVETSAPPQIALPPFPSGPIQR